MNLTESDREIDIMNILEVENLRKHFGELLALNDVSFSIEEGSICGLLGPNGAGKTTLLRIINAILVSDGGTVRVKGEPVSLATSPFIGYMPEERGLYDQMRVEDQIIYFGRLKGGEKSRLKEVMREYIDLFNLTGQEKRRVKELSKGNQQKVQIIATLVHEPELVILDEPFSGFDPINGAILQELISRLHDRGTTIMLSSHNMPAIEEMCSDIALINHGNLLVKDSIQNIKEMHKDNSLLLTTEKPLSIPMLMDSGKVEHIEPTSTKQWRKGNAYRILKRPDVRNLDILDAVAIQSEILHFEEALPSLTDIFISYTSGGKDTVSNTENV